MKQPEFLTIITERRKEFGPTREESAEKYNVTMRSIQRIESGIVTSRMYSITI